MPRKRGPGPRPITATLTERALHVLDIYSSVSGLTQGESLNEIIEQFDIRGAISILAERRLAKLATPRNIGVPTPASHQVEGGESAIPKPVQGEAERAAEASRLSIEEEMRSKWVGK